MDDLTRVLFQHCSRQEIYFMGDSLLESEPYKNRLVARGAGFGNMQKAFPDELLNLRTFNFQLQR